MKYSAFWTGVALAMLFSCSSGSDQQALEEIHFTVDYAYLGKAVKSPETGIKFYPPANWLPLRPEVFSGLKERLEKEFIMGENYHIDILHLFLDEENRCIASLCKLRVPALKNGLENAMRQYHRLLENSVSPQPVKKTTYRKDDIPFYQFLINGRQRVNYKLVFPDRNGQLLQMDYIVPAEHYANQLKGIESSIGSIQYYNPGE